MSDISFNLRQSEILGLIGSNGAGKTTTMRMPSPVLETDHSDVKVES